MSRAYAVPLICSMFVPSSFAGNSPMTATGQAGPNLQAIVIFLLFVLVTFGITYWAAARTRSASDFYTAGGSITGMQNGLAIAGDFMSAATLFGFTSMVFASGFDGLVFTVSAFLGWPLITFLMAERLRNLGRFTFADIIAFRLDPIHTRVFSAFSSLVVVCFYLIVQMVGAGQLIQLLFGLDYVYAVVGVGVLMMVYVTFGGMVAATWVQIIKAVLLLGGGLTLLFLVFRHFDFSVDSIIRDAVSTHKQGELIMGSLKLSKDPVALVSLALGMVFGLAGLPHIMMRFFTVPNAKAARKSVFVATGLIGVFFLVICLLGMAAISVVGGSGQYYLNGDTSGTLLGGNNMAVMHLAQALGGTLMFGFLAAVAFATIVAVVSGLALAGASAISHDLYANVIRRGKATEKQEMRVSRLATLGIGLIAIGLGILFEGQSVAFLVALTFAVAASANFPVLILSMYWRGLTTRGAVWGGVAGLSSSVALVVMSPAVWVTVLGRQEAWFPYDYPTLFSMPLAFAVAWVVSVLDGSARAVSEKAAFEGQSVRAETGWGRGEAARH